MLYKEIFCFSSKADTRTLVKRSSPDVITGRGFAAPPKLNIESYSSPSSSGPSYYSDNLTRGQYGYYSEERDKEAYLPHAEYQHDYQYEDISGHYQRSKTYQSSPYLPSSDYDRLKDKLYTNDQLRSYIKDLKQQINKYENIVPHNYERGTKIDLRRYNHNEPYTKRYLNYDSCFYTRDSFTGNTNQGLETEKWLRSRQQQNQIQHVGPVQVQQN